MYRYQVKRNKYNNVETVTKHAHVYINYHGFDFYLASYIVK